MFVWALPGCSGSRVLSVDRPTVRRWRFAGHRSSSCRRTPHRWSSTTTPDADLTVSVPTARRENDRTRERPGPDRVGAAAPTPAPPPPPTPTPQPLRPPPPWQPCAPADSIPWRPRSQPPVHPTRRDQSNTSSATGKPHRAQVASTTDLVNRSTPRHRHLTCALFGAYPRGDIRSGRGCRDQSVRRYGSPV